MDHPLLGAQTPRLVLYLPNPPQMPAQAAHWTAPDVAQLISQNGNHWRKILTILAKLCSTQLHWRDYRDQQLLQQSEAISFGSQLHPGVEWHLVAGKTSWQRLGLAPEDFDSLDTEGRVRVRGNILLIPYPDYRQFPNRTLEQVREWMQMKSEKRNPQEMAGSV